MIDLLFRGARVVDGTGAPAFMADVAVSGPRVAAVGDLGSAPARQVVHADGAVLAPGFIDLHTHADFTLPVHPRADSMVRQGVTTLVTGNCGFSPFPAPPGRRGLLQEFCRFFDAGLSWDWVDADGYRRALAGAPLACNVALQVGHGAVRVAVLGFADRSPTGPEMDAMRQHVAQSLEVGVVGLSSGLSYAPASYARTPEVVTLAREVARAGGFYSTHMRDEGDRLLEAVDEALDIGRQAGVPVQISHHKVLGRRNWGRVRDALARIDAARAGGLDVTLDQYPYTASSTTFATLLPRWVLEGGVEAMRGRLRDPATRARIRAEMDAPPDAPRLHSMGGFEPRDVLLAGIPDGPNRRYQGMRLDAVAAERSQPPLDAVLDLLAAEGGGVQMVVFGRMDEEDVRTVMTHPSVAVASDGWTLSPAEGGLPHPRSYGTFARVLGHYVRQEGVLPLEEAIRKMASLPARRLGLGDRGRITPGAAADLVLFDPAHVTDRATFEAPHQFAAGVLQVVVNGQVVVQDGTDTGAAAGRVLGRGHPTPPAGVHG